MKNTNILMRGKSAQVITVQELQDLRSSIVHGSRDDIIKAYRKLEDKGYTYASWAKDVVIGHIIIGVVIVNFI